MQKPVSASKESWSPDYLVQWSGYAVIKKVNKRVRVIHYKSPVMRKCSTAIYFQQDLHSNSLENKRRHAASSLHFGVNIHGRGLWKAE